MRKVNKFMDKLFDIAPGGVYGLIGVILGLTLLLTAIFQYPGLNLTTDNISNLGVGPGLSALLFNLACIESGILFIPFYVYIGRILLEKEEKEATKKIATKIAIIGCVFLSLIGFFPSKGTIVLILHLTSAIIFFLSCFAYSILFSVVTFKDDRFPKGMSYLSMISAAIFVAYVVTQMVLLEWFSFFILLFWGLVGSLYTLYKKL
jgi:hypothetical membrane protein